MSVANILVVEDDAVSRTLLTGYFENAGFTVTACESAEQCENIIEAKNIDVCLIDIQLPGQDGLSLTRAIRKTSNVGIILVTGMDEVGDRIDGLESGADDYVIKPFEADELLSRVRSILRRLQMGPLTSSTKMQFDGWVLHLNKQELTAPDDAVITLSLAEHRLAQVFIENVGQMLSRSELLKLVRNREWYPDSRYVDVLVGQLRRKLKKHAPDKTYITTVHSKGYVFEF